MSRDEAVLEERLSVLSPALRSAWAKSASEDGDPFALWLPLVGHAMDAAGVAGALWEHWLSVSQRELICEGFSRPPGGEESPQAHGRDPANCSVPLSERLQHESRAIYEEAREFVMLAAALHDIGKISKPFARQVTVLAEQMRQEGLRTASNQTSEAKENRWMKHGLAGSVAISKVGPTLAWNRTVTSSLASLAGGHHGTPVQADQLSVARKDRLHFLIEDESSDPWLDAQREFAEFCQWFVGDPNLEGEVAFSTSALVIIQGIVMMADWISSSTLYFPLTARSDRTFRYLRQADGQSGRVKRALARLDLPPQWSPTDTGDDASTLLKRKFGVDFQARPLQRAAVETARSLPGPGLLIIEDAMGAGKTEAALLAAEILASRFGANGLVIALPTQATTNAMFSRLLDFLAFSFEVPPQSGREESTAEHLTAPSTALIHGRAHWNNEFVNLVQAGRHFLDQTAGAPSIDIGQGTVEVDEPVAVVHPWLRGRNKAILSTFVATTVDHLLMGALQMKHLAFRHLGLSSKVVIFDEVHASSQFMNFFAERVVEWLGSYRVCVVMLSATLTSELRDRLGRAYRHGLTATGWDEPDTDVLSYHSTQYPRLTEVSAASTRIVPIAPATPPREVHIVAARPDETPVNVAIRLASAGEGNLLVLTNTVARAQKTFEELQSRYGDAVRLVHARFTAADRMANDQWLLDTYGPHARHRPSFSIVVATQVVEQSLDVDFDGLVTDVAPVDLVLQRLGRVHRHRGRRRPESFSQPVCHLVGVPPLAARPDTSAPALAAAARVYGLKPVLDGVLALGARIFDPPGARIELPGDIGRLVECASQQDFTVPTEWVVALTKAQANWERDAARAEDEISKTRLAPPGRRLGRYPTLDNWYSTAARAGDDGPARAARSRVRDGLEGLDVVLLREIGGDLYTMPTAGHPRGELLALDAVPDAWLAREALLGTVTLPSWSVESGDGPDATIADLEARCWGPAWNASPLLSGELFLPLSGDTAVLNGFHLHYSQAIGLEVTRDK